MPVGRSRLALLVALLLALTGCLPPAATPPSPTAVTAATGAPGAPGSGRPVAEGPAVGGDAPGATIAPSPPPSRPAPEPRWSSRVVQRLLQGVLDDARTSLRIPGISATIIFPDGTAWTGVSGLADVDAGTPVEPDTAFAIASISKTFLAALVLELSAEGRFGLDDPAVRHLPTLGIKLDPRITIRMLLDHTSGLADYFLTGRIDVALQRDPARSWTAAQALKYVGKPWFEPGTDWAYSNTNYLLLGLLVEHVTGEPVAALLRQRFLGPLGLRTTWYQAAERPRGDLAHGYQLSGLGSKTRAIDLADGSGVAPFKSVVTAADAAGSLAASSRDVAEWARALYDGQAISSASLARMVGDVGHVAAYRPRIPYGLGVQAVELAGHPTLGHSGRFLGFRSVMRWLPDHSVAIAVLTNQSRVDPGLTAARLLEIVLPGPNPRQVVHPD